MHARTTENLPAWLILAVLVLLVGAGVAVAVSPVLVILPLGIMGRFIVLQIRS